MQIPGRLSAGRCDEMSCRLGAGKCEIQIPGRLSASKRENISSRVVHSVDLVSFHTVSAPTSLLEWFIVFIFAKFFFAKKLGENFLTHSLVSHCLF